MNMTFSISSLVSALNPYLPSSFAVGLDMGVSGWYQGRYGKCYVIISYYYMTINVSFIWLAKAWNFFLIELYKYCLSLQFPQRWISIVPEKSFERCINLTWLYNRKTPTFNFSVMWGNITFQRLIWNDLN